MQEEANAMFQMRFPQKLWYLLSLRTDAILWGGTGKTILLNYRILHSYLQCDHSIFKTTNISSFVRQLNLYGFRKVTSHSQDPLCNSSNPHLHEYAHDFFQYGRPKLLNKIIRKALTMKKHYKTKSIYSEEELMSFNLTPLQKARQAFQMALRKAAYDLYSQTSPTTLYFKCEDVPEDYCEDEESYELDWLKPKIQNNDSETQFSYTAPAEEETKDDTHIVPEANYNNYGSIPTDIMINFADESSQQNNASDNFSSQFLSMPELDIAPAEEHHGVELLAEFNINDDTDEGVARKIDEKIDSADALSYLNCVLPSISNDPIDDVSMAERMNEFSGDHGEWDQMFNDIIASRGPTQECGSDLKELYSQISKTIDLLNS